MGTYMVVSIEVEVFFEKSWQLTLPQWPSG